MKPLATAYSQRLLRGQTPSYERLQARFAEDGSELNACPVAVHCGWGRLLIGHTFPDPVTLAEELLNEQPGERDIALYVAAPQQVLAQSPQQLFLDPSDTLRLWFTDYRQATRVFRGFRIRRAQSEADWNAINTLYLSRSMLPIDPTLLTSRHDGGPVYWMAEDEDSGAVIGSVMGLNHHTAFNDPENGSSLWCLAVDPLCSRPGVGEVLVRHLVEHFMSRGLSYLDLSVLHDNAQAKNLYAKLGFRTLSTFAIKRKNGINQPLFLGPGPEVGLNPYASILVEEAYKRGIDVQIDDAAAGLFTLSHGGRRIRCRESLSDLTSAISMSLCQDKCLTHKVLSQAGLNVPTQQLAGNADDNLAFVEEHGRVVVKPVDGEQGNGVAVDLDSIEQVQQAIEAARAFDSRVLLESFHEGLDLRIVVIGFEVVAAAIRRPAQVIGDGQHRIQRLIEAQSRRRQAATGGESRI
ncbi:N-acetylglutaminylglutamine synthetase, partial [Pseudomonas sp. FSL R10-0056]